MSKKIVIRNDSQLFSRIGNIIQEARNQTVRVVNTILVKTYWEIGREIVEYELGGKSRAEYGEESLKNLASELTKRYGMGFSYRNLQKMKQFYLAYSIVPTLSAQSLAAKGVTASSQFQKSISPVLSTKSFILEKILTRLSWSHICLLLAVSDKDARSFYEIEIAKNNWSVRETKRQIESMFFERLVLSNDPMGIILCYEKDDEFVEYVLKDEKTIFAKKYLLSLPDKQKLLAEVKRLKDNFEREHYSNN